MATRWSRPSRYAAVGATVLALMLTACTNRPAPQPAPTSRPVVNINDPNYCPTRMAPVTAALEFCQAWVAATKVELLYLRTVVSTQSDGVVYGLDADLRQWFSDDARNDIKSLAPRPSLKDRDDPGQIFDFTHIQALHIVYGDEKFDYGGRIVTVYETWRVQPCADQVGPSGNCNAIGPPRYAYPPGKSVGGGPGIARNQYYLAQRTQPNQFGNHFFVNRIRRGVS
jgi:hypothetical protein